MTRDEIQQRCDSIREWDRRERTRMLREQSELKDAKLAPLIEVCGKLGHAPVRGWGHNIFGEELMACKWCGASCGVGDGGNS